MTLENDNSDVEDDEKYISSDSEEDWFFESGQQSNMFDDGFHMENAHQGSATAYDNFRLPENIKSKKNMCIADVIKEHVLPLLPAKSLCRFKTVCKEWNEWITNPFLAHKQSHCFQDISGFFYQICGEHFFISRDPDAYGIPSPSLGFLPEPVTLKSTCNGLICCQSYIGENAYYICNPVNQDWRVLPRPNYYHGPESAAVLAFEPSTFNFAANYELVCAFPLADHPVIYFEIYSSRSKSWRLVDNLCYELGDVKLSDDGFYMKGVVYWETSAGTILAFDLKNEHFGILPLPLESGPGGVLTKMHGELCYIMPHKQDNGYEIRIYGDFNMVLKQIIPLDSEVFTYIYGELRALACLNDDVLVILAKNRMIIYHVKEKKAEMLSSLTDAFVSYHPYVNSLVPVGNPLVRQQEANSHL
uniref:Uncharacterized protein n=1 Tax=Fagus sylvatica TaxID=28930 RepID=A0A2N9IY80_FAGSY